MTENEKRMFWTEQKFLNKFKKKTPVKSTPAARCLVNKKYKWWMFGEN